MTPKSEVINGDCMELLRQLPDKSFKIAIVAPPYGLSPKSTQGSGKLKNRTLNQGHISRWDVRPEQEYFDELMRVSENQIIWGGNYFPLPPCRCFVVWDKQQPWPNFSQAELAWTSFDKPAKLVTVSKSSGGKKIHPTQKPVDLYAYLLRQFCKPGDTILDTHLGSGSSRIAAYKMGFDFTGCEIDPEYYDLQERRFRKECLGEVETPEGKTFVQQSLF